MMSGHTRCEQESKKAKWSQIGAVTWEEVAYPQASSAESRLVQTSPSVQIHQIGDVKPMFMSYRSSSYIGKTLSYSFLNCTSSNKITYTTCAIRFQVECTYFEILFSTWC
jgi:hypothetical protein